MAGLPARIILKLKRAGIHPQKGQLAWASSLAQAGARARRWSAR
ncbi:MAG: hypothetical protein RLP45_01825 [Haliea sp.]